jgi:hypothetical protein
MLGQRAARACCSASPLVMTATRHFHDGVLTPWWAAPSCAGGYLFRASSADSRSKFCSLQGAAMCRTASFTISLLTS